jgi:hypothetical protein
MPTDREIYDELSFYTLGLGDQAFLHQNIVDAYAAQHVDEHTKPIRTVFALIGLYLTLEKGFTGRQVQRMHMRLAKQRKQWPKLSPPETTASVTVSDVLAAAPGETRDHAIRNWCAAVWEIWQPQRDVIVDLAHAKLGIS